MKKMLATVLALGVLLSGCSLAVEEQHQDGRIREDYLAGVVVTTEHLNLIDMEQYLSDHPEVLDGGVIDTTGYEQRIYAQEVVEESATEDGQICYTTTYNFDHVEGIALLDYLVTTVLEDGTEVSSYWTGDCDEGFWDVHFGNKYTEGTIYVPAWTENAVFYVNPVYRDEDGRLYLTGGTGISSQNMMPGASMWKNITQTQTVDNNGETTTREREFKVIVKCVAFADTVTILQMDASHQILEQLTCTPESVPEEITPAEGCAYILVEQRTGDAVNRTLLQPGDRDVTVHRPLEGEAYCTGTVMEIHWPQE